ncbi:MAG TPA: hypothetical protein VK493_15135 [Bryobacteraceae bacterium]|nr:hypothetical protein [Bryobacteraceae bacterium]
MTSNRILGTIVSTLLASASLQAVPVITPQGTALGFSLTNVITGTPGSTSSFDVLGIAVNSAG